MSIPSSQDFKEVFFDDFSGGIDRSIWKSLYSGPYNNGMYRWTEGQVWTGNGELTIRTEKKGGEWVSGGLSTIPDGLTHGRIEFSAMLEKGQGTTGIALLWPSSNEWTDEINIMEANRPDRSQFAFTNHGKPWETKYIDIDVSKWHTYTLDWLPDSLTLYVDGQKVAHMTHDIPDQEMSLAFQGRVNAPNEWWFGGGPNGSTPGKVDMKVDWVRVSEWAPGEGGARTAPETQGVQQGGGSGADTHVFHAWDGAATIRGFEVGQDRIETHTTLGYRPWIENARHQQDGETGTLLTYGWNDDKIFLPGVTGVSVSDIIASASTTHGTSVSPWG